MIFDRVGCAVAAVLTALFVYFAIITSRVGAVSSDGYWQSMGFFDQQEVLRMVASVPLEDKAAYEAFRVWRDFDGTKAGLQKLLDAVNAERRTVEQP